jgi:hypothetical protein
MMAMLSDTCCCISTPSLHDLSTWGGYFVFFFGKAWLLWGVLFLLLKDNRLSFSSYLKCHQKATYKWVAAVTSLTIGTEMLAFVFANWLEMVPSIWVARLLVHCVLSGSITELLFSFCMRSVLAFLQIGDAIIGEVISSIVIALALKVHCDT